MKLITPKILLLFLFCLISVFVSVRSTLNQGGQLNSSLNKEEIEKSCGVGDCGGYIRYEEGLFNSQSPFRSSLEYYLRAWPPGMPLFIHAIVKVTGDDHYVTKMAVVVGVLYGLAFFLIFYSLSGFGSSVFPFLLILMLLFMETFTLWNLGLGVLYAESKSFPLFLASIAALVLGFRASSSKFMILAGLLMGLSAYFRAFFGPVGTVFFGGLLLIPISYLRFTPWKGVITLIYDKKMNQLFPLFKKAFSEIISPARRRFLVLVSLPFLVFQISLLPWKLHNYYYYNQFVFTNPSDSTWAILWLPPELLPGFVAAGNSACISDPELCAVIKEHPSDYPIQSLKKLAIMTFIKHPFRWYGYRLENFHWLWVSRPWKINDMTSFFFVAESILYAILGLAGFVLVRRSWKVEQVRYFSWGVILFCLLNVAIFSLVHFEYRYSGPLRFFFFFFPFWVLSLRKAPEVEGVKT